ncbi:ImcF-related family protein [Cupriavidus sp. AcVe19-1a]|uniref:ImcF-related family protein n=1 Tax=Cupriavidus sp. AcVe19-1a TaxID=2821359 RepID=UPI001AE63748|nr:ImcF-related family protein [Cupriavidus sp. AcVe19-1a]MBP0629587.1 type VI secretion protein VasK [Cupriavidus sp. AcVe19-1a]
MKKLRIDLLSLLVLALMIAGAIVIWGDWLGIKTPDARSLWLSLLAIGTLVLAVIFSFDRVGRWWDAARALSMWLRQREPELAGTTQASLPAPPAAQHSRNDFDTLRFELQRRHGLRWRYRLPWLLLIGDDDAIARLVPEINEQGWLVTADAVLLSSKCRNDGQPDASWLKQLYRLRRRRPIEAIVLIQGEQTVPSREHPGPGAVATHLARITEALRWSAPIYLLEVGPTNSPSAWDAPIIACEVPRQASATAIEGALQDLRYQLSHRSLAQLPQNGAERYLGKLSQRLDSRGKALADWLAVLAGDAHRRLPIRGIAFAPCAAPIQANGPASQGADLPLWQYLGQAAQRQPGRRTGWHPLTLSAGLALVALGLWIAGMLVSGLQNGRDIHMAQQAVRDIQSAPNAAVQLKALDTLQQQIQRYEYRVHHHAPLSTRFGLNRDADVLAALWKPYAKASRDILVAPAAQDLEAALVDLSQLQAGGISEEASKWALAGHNTLKAYLMLAQPERADAPFLAQQLAQHWPTDARITPGEKQDMAERLFKFYAEHLKANPAWRIEPRPELIAGARQTLLEVIGERNAQDTVYQGILDGAGSKYPDQTLASLTAGTDPRGLLRASAIVPGVFTRQAYEGYVAAAIEEAAKRKQVASDWVLAGGKPSPLAADKGSGKDLQSALTEQYFAEYAEHWQQFMNSTQWEPAPTLPAAVDQLKLMADARQSPVIALMKSLEYQGGAGARKDSLSDTLVNKARDLIGKKTETPEVARTDPAGPLGVAFGPVLRLVGQAGQGQPGGNGDLSLQRFLDRATALRLRLQQISSSGDGDAQARQMAQALFQGKGSELAETQAYAQLIAASLGTQWAGMGETLFVRPIAQATQTVLVPAQASLNEAWRESIAMAWGRSFAGRYPFADTANDASLPELARFLRPQSGLISAFLATNLAGVLELQGDQWVPSANGAQALTFDPAFLQAINSLQRIAAHLLAHGEPSYRFELRPIPTPGLTDTLLTVDNQKLHYFNQRESWQSMIWPANNLQDPGTCLQWQTDKAGTSKNYEFIGRWGLVRMLERARIVPVDSATFQLTWQASPDTRERKSTRGETASEGDASNLANSDSLNARGAKASAPVEMTYPISYQLRTEVGQGPLELLGLRGFVLPSRIFTGKEPATRLAPVSRK